MYQYMYIILTFSMAGVIVGCRYIDFLQSKFFFVSDSFVCYSFQTKTFFLWLTIVLL